MTPDRYHLAILSDQIISKTTPPITLTPDVREHLRNLKAKYAFSAKLMLAYHGVILLLLIISSIRRRMQRSRRRHRQGVNDDPEGRRSRGSYSTKLFRQGIQAHGRNSNRMPVGDEDLPLLPSRHRPRSGTIWNKWMSILMYEPEPLPFFNRGMPSNATSLLICGVFALNVFFLLFLVDFWNTDAPSVMGDRAAWLFIANLPWLYMLAAKHQPIQLLTGHSYENLNILHRRLGEWLCVLAVTHGIGMLVSWYNFLRPLGLSLPHFLTITYIAFGLVAFLSYELLYLTSLASLRAWWYEAFLGCHVILQAVALVSLLLHHHESRAYVGMALTIFLLDRLAIRWGMKTSSFEADLTILEDGETVLVSVNWPVGHSSKPSWLSWTDRGMHRGWGSSEHVFITVPELGRKHRIQAHPFTIASAAPGENATHAWLNLIVRAQTGFSRDLLRHAERHSTAAVRLDGPYGSSHALELLEHSDVRVIVAGGSGIAVAYPLLWHCLTQPKDDTETTCKGRFHLVWIVQDASHISWLGNERLGELRERGLDVILPPPTRKFGRPDIKSLLRELIEGDPRMDADELGVSVLVSGPDQLNRSVRNTCAAMVGEGWAIDVAVEKYGW